MPAEPDGGSGDMLRFDLAARLAVDDLRFRLTVQRYVDERRTPIEDASVLWKRSVARPVEIATVVIPRQDILDSNGARARAFVDELKFNPWNAPPQFRPLGSLNRLFRVLYELGP